MSCHQRELELSAYLDGELSNDAACELIHHLEACAPCRQREGELRRLGSALRGLPVPESPPRLALRLRVLASHYAVRGRRLAYFRLRLSMLIEALALPMAVGTCAALVLFGFLVGDAAPKHPGDPAVPDQLLSLASPPRLLAAPGYDLGAPVLVDAEIDSSGRVYNYRLLSGPANDDVIARLNNQLSLALFHPATSVLGQPTAGSVVVSFGRVDVRG